MGNQGTDGRWLITRITSIYEKDALTPALPSTRLNLDPVVLAADRPSYRCLAWDLNRNGYQVGVSHLGDDQPTAVHRQYRDEITWLAESPAPATSAGSRKEESA